MTFKIKAFEVLKSEFENQITALRGRHNAATNKDLRQPRRAQVEFLYAALDIIDKSALAPMEKARTFTGLMLIISAQIEASYALLSSKRSFLDKALLEVMGVSDDNKMDGNCRATVVGAALRLMTSEIFEKGTSKSKKLRETHAFSGIEGFDSSAFWHTGTALKHDAENAVMQVAEDELKNSIAKREAEQNVGKSFFSRFWSVPATSEAGGVATNEPETIAPK